MEGNLIYSKSTHLNVDLIQNIPSQKYPEQCLAKCLVTVIQPSWHMTLAIIGGYQYTPQHKDIRKILLFCLSHLRMSLCPHSPGLANISVSAMVFFSCFFGLPFLDSNKNFFAAISVANTVAISPSALQGSYLACCSAPSVSIGSEVFFHHQPHAWMWKPSWIYSWTQGYFPRHSATAGTLWILPPCKNDHPENPSISFPAPSSLVRSQPPSQPPHINLWSLAEIWYRWGPF